MSGINRNANTACLISDSCPSKTLRHVQDFLINQPCRKDNRTEFDSLGYHNGARPSVYVHSRVTPTAVVSYDAHTCLSVFNVEERFAIDETAANGALGLEELKQSAADSQFPHIYWNGFRKWIYQSKTIIANNALHNH